jgi:hypothetical protein
MANQSSYRFGKSHIFASDLFSSTQRVVCLEARASQNTFPEALSFREG